MTVHHLCGLHRSIGTVQVQGCFGQFVTWDMLFWDLTQRRLVMPYQHFGTTCRSHLQGSSGPRRTTLHCVKIPEECRSHLCHAGSLESCIICNMFKFLEWGVVSPSPNPQDEGHPLSTFHDCLFDISVATFHIWRRFPPSTNSECSMLWWQRPTSYHDSSISTLTSGTIHVMAECRAKTMVISGVCSPSEWIYFLIQTALPTVMPLTPVQMYHHHISLLPSSLWLRSNSFPLKLNAFLGELEELLLCLSLRE